MHIKEEVGKCECPTGKEIHPSTPGENIQNKVNYWEGNRPMFFSECNFFKEDLWTLELENDSELGKVQL